VNTLKIDRCSINEMLHSDKDRAIAEAVIGLGRKLGLSVLAEGIESQAVLDRLKSLNRDQGQGYHLGRPMPPEQLNSWVRNHVLGTATRTHETTDPAADPQPPTGG
jgi:EAL domain-containing protein (putative c-di-GMP-specific phosphodiesterase class I)